MYFNHYYKSKQPNGLLIVSLNDIAVKRILDLILKGFFSVMLNCGLMSK